MKKEEGAVAEAHLIMINSPLNTALCYRQCETLLSHGEEEFKLNAGEIINRKCVHKCNAWEHEPIKFWPVRQTLSAFDQSMSMSVKSNPFELLKCPPPQP